VLRSHVISRPGTGAPQPLLRVARKGEGSTDDLHSHSRPPRPPHSSPRRSIRPPVSTARDRIPTLRMGPPAQRAHDVCGVASGSGSAGPPGSRHGSSAPCSPRASAPERGAGQPRASERCNGEPAPTETRRWSGASRRRRRGSLCPDRSREVPLPRAALVSAPSRERQRRCASVWLVKLLRTA
jgi:hypothetical protein